MTTLRFLAFVTCLAPLVAAGQSPRPYSQTGSERADFIGNSQTVPKGHIQLESGLSVTYLTSYKRRRYGFGVSLFREARGPSVNTHTTTGPEALIRIGLDRGVEFRVKIPERVDSEINLETPFNALSIGSKMELKRTTNFNLATTVMASVQVGDLDADERTIVPEVAISASYQPSSRKWVRTRVMATMSPNYGKIVPVWSVALLVGASPSQGYNVYLGAAITTSDDNVYRTAMIFSGLSYEFFDFIIFDLHGGIGITEESPNAQLGSGLSIRV